MVNSYITLIDEDSNIINSQVHNVGIDNHYVKELARQIKLLVKDNVELIYEKTDDNRSYHISSDKIKNKLNFDYHFTINDAIKDLIYAFETKKLTDTFNNSNFFNIKKMQEINLV